MVRALKAHLLSVAFTTAYQNALERTVLCTPCDGDTQTIATNSKVLKNLNTLPVLQFVWIESGYINQLELEETGLTMSIGESNLTTHGLAVMLADTPSAVSASIKRVDAIVTAGAAYGLISRRQVHVKRTTIAGTVALHDLMVLTSNDHYRALEGRSATDQTPHAVG